MLLYLDLRKEKMMSETGGDRGCSSWVIELGTVLVSLCLSKHFKRKM